MHFLPTTLLLLATLSLAKPLPNTSTSLAEIERRWSTGETEVCRPNSPGCYFFAWFHSLAAFYHGATTTTTDSVRNACALFQREINADRPVF